MSAHVLGLGLAIGYLFLSPAIHSATIFSDGFETGALGPEWTITGTGNYRTQRTSLNTPRTGSYHLTMDSSIDISNARNEGTLTINLAGYTDVMLTFWAKDYNDDPNGPPTTPFTTGADFDGVAISADGVTWYEVQELRTSITSVYQQYLVNLDAARSTYGLTYGTQFKIRFNQYDDYPIATDGIAIDDVLITGNLALPQPVTLFSEDFSSGTFQSWWTRTGTGSYRTQITSANVPQSGAYHMTLDSSVSSAYARNEATLTANLAGYDSIVLYFWAKKFGDEPNGPPSVPFTGSADFDGVAISSDGITWYEVQGLRNTVTSSYTQFAVALDPVVSTYALSYNSPFQIRFNQYDNFPIATDGIAIDNIVITGYPADDLKILGNQTSILYDYDLDVYAPSTLPFTIANTGTTNLSWTALLTGNWFDLSASSGSLSGQASTNITLTLNAIGSALNLDDGPYNVKAVFTNTTSGNVRFRDASLDVLPYNLPRTLTDANGFLWDVYLSGYISNGTINAYDGGHLLTVNTSAFPNFTQGRPRMDGREVELGPTSMGGLTVKRRIFVPSNQAYARFLEVLTNPGTATVNATVKIYTNLGSDSGTVLVKTSDGDTTFETTDNWIVTDDADGSGNPTIVHVLSGFDAASGLIYTSAPTGYLYFDYAVTIPPGETRVVMHIGVQNANRATALSQAPLLTYQDINVAVGIPDALRASVVNFDLPIPITLPYNLTDAEGFLWDIWSDGQINDGTSDAYDGGHDLSIDGLPFVSDAGATRRLGAREIEVGPDSLSGLDVRRRIYVPDDAGFVRYLEILTNPGTTAVNATVQLRTDLGSDNSTVLVDTSDGDTTFETTDNWIVTDDADGTGDPTVAHVVSGFQGSVMPSYVYQSAPMDALDYHYSVTVPVGETRVLMHFGAQNSNRATALAKAAGFVIPDAISLHGVSPYLQERMLNFDSRPPITVALPASAKEGNGVLANAGSVTISAPAAGSVVVTLTSSDTTEIMVPSTVTIYAGQTSAAFNLTIVDDAVSDGSQTARVAAVASGYSARSAACRVLDNDLSYFSWNPIASPQYAHNSFSATVTARDPDGQIAASFNGQVSLSCQQQTAVTNKIAITEVSPSGANAVEFTNVSNAAVDLSNWKIIIYDWANWPTPNPTFTIPAGTICPSGTIFTLVDYGTFPGVYPTFYTGSNIDWISGDSTVAVLLLDAAGAIVDFVKANNASTITSPTTIPQQEWNGLGCPVATSSNSYHRTGSEDHNNVSDWVSSAPDMGILNTGLQIPFTTTGAVQITPSTSGNFISGAWTGNITVMAQGNNTVLTATSSLGPTASSNSFTVLPPLVTVTVPEIAKEGNGVLSNAGTVTIPVAATGNLLVSLSFSDPSEATVPTAVTILSGQTLTTFDVTIVDDSISDGAQVVTISASASGFSSSIDTTTVRDNDLSYFSWNSIASPQHAHNSFPATVTARDPDGQIAASFNGQLSLSCQQQTAVTNKIAITEVSPSGTNAVEFTNISNAAVDLSNWKIIIYDWYQWPVPNPTFTIPAGTICPAGAIFTLVDNGAFPGVYPTFYTGADIDWLSGDSTVAVLLLNSAGAIVDFFKTNNGSTITNPMTIPPQEWSGSGFTVTTGSNSYRRIGGEDHNNASDWSASAPNMGVLNVGLQIPFTTTGAVQMTPSISGNFVSGAWTGDIAILAPGSNTVLTATSTLGPTGSSNSFNVLPPLVTVTVPEIAKEGNGVLSNAGSVTIPVAATGNVIVSLTSSDPSEAPVPATVTIMAGQTLAAFDITIVDDSISDSAQSVTISASTAGFSDSFDTMTVRDNDISYFSWNTVASPQYAYNGFPVTITARDPDGDIAEGFFGSVQLTCLTGEDASSPILITEVEPGTPDAVEFTNVSNTNMDLSNWSIVSYDNGWPVPETTTIIPAGTMCPPGEVFKIVEFGTSPGVYPTFYTGANISWLSTATYVGVLLLDADGNIVDFFATGTSSSITAPTAIPGSEWSGIGVPTTTGVNTYHRIGSDDHNDASDWIASSANIGSLNVGLQIPFTTIMEIPMTPSMTDAFEAGVWAGSATLDLLADNVWLKSTDSQGHTGQSNSFAVILLPLTVMVPETVREGDGVLPNSCSVTIPTARSSSLTVHLDSNDISEVRVPPSIVIPPGTTHSIFDITVMDGTANDGNQSIMITAEAENCVGSTDTITVEDNDPSEFVFDVIPSPQITDQPFLVTITAKDPTGGIAEGFNDQVDFFADTALNSPILITEVAPGTPDIMEFTNVSGSSVDISNWKIVTYDYDSWPDLLNTFEFPAGTICPPGGLFLLIETGSPPGEYPYFYTPFTINWAPGSTQVGVLLLNELGAIVDFFTTGASSQITNPVPIPTNEWTGPGAPATSQDNTHQREGNSDNNDNSDWIAGSFNIGTINPAMSLPFSVNFDPINVLPQWSTNFVDGIWIGEISVLEGIDDLVIGAVAENGISGESNEFDVDDTLYVTNWETISNHNGIGDISRSIQPGFVNSIKTEKIKVTFNIPVASSTINISVLSINGQNGGNLSSLVEQVTTENGEESVLIDLVSALPDMDSYVLAIDCSVADSDGREIIGNRCIMLSSLFGDLDGNRIVDEDDLQLMSDAVGNPFDSSNAQFDLNQDGVVNAADMDRISDVLLGHTLALPIISCNTATTPCNVICVDRNAIGLNHGEGWIDAFIDLQDALAMAESGDQIWVAAGTYVPTTNGDRNISFVLPSSVSLYGGFAGFELRIEDRNPTLYPTILSGDLNQDDNSTQNPWDNSFHVVQVVTGTANAVLDGFVISNGNAHAAFGSKNGGGLRVTAGSVLVRNSQFLDNISDGMGGGLAAVSNAQVIIFNCAFFDNSATRGGGVAILSGSIASLTNCRIAYNHADLDAAGIYSSLSSLTLENCTVSYNGTTEDVRGIFSGSTVFLRIINSIVWNNGGPSLNGDLFVDPSNPVDVSFNFVRQSRTNLTLNSTNLTGETDPFFLDPLGYDFHLRFDSPCIDAGTNAVQSETDIDGEARFEAPDHENVFSIVDIGADEFVDTDFDSLSDWEETNVVGSSIDLADSDGDGLSDSFEFYYDSGTGNNLSPNSIDSDGDGVSDCNEIIAGRAPTVANFYENLPFAANFTASALNLFFASTSGARSGENIPIEDWEDEMIYIDPDLSIVIPFSFDSNGWDEFSSGGARSQSTVVQDTLLVEPNAVVGKLLSVPETDALWVDFLIRFTTNHTSLPDLPVSVEPEELSSANLQFDLIDNHLAFRDYDQGTASWTWNILAQTHLKTGKWNRLSIRYNYAVDPATADLYVDSRLLRSGIVLPMALQRYNGFFVDTHTAIGQVEIDEVSVQETVPKRIQNQGNSRAVLIHNITLQSGWNTLSVPVDSLNTIDEIFGMHGIKTIWRRTPGSPFTEQLRVTNYLEAYTGYFVYSADDNIMVSIPGVVPETHDLQVYNGWNLIGSTGALQLTTLPHIHWLAWYWDVNQSRFRVAHSSPWRTAILLYAWQDTTISLFADEDRDFVDDVWELGQFGTLMRTPYGDADEDGLSNIAELYMEADPNNSDSDLDYVSDGAEFRGRTNPTSFDSFGNWSPSNPIYFESFDGVNPTLLANYDLWDVKTSGMVRIENNTLRILNGVDFYSEIQRIFQDREETHVWLEFSMKHAGGQPLFNSLDPEVGLVFAVDENNHLNSWNHQSDSWTVDMSYEFTPGVFHTLSVHIDNDNERFYLYVGTSQIFAAESLLFNTNELPNLPGLLSIGFWGSGQIEVDNIAIYTMPSPSVDAVDSDGLPDTWEITTFGNTSQTASGDSDADSLTNQEEFLRGTNPALADTDADGMPDGWEVENGLDPTFDDSGWDNDGDNLTNIDEYDLGNGPTLANDPDLDNDGVLDGYDTDQSTLTIHSEIWDTASPDWSISTNAWSDKSGWLDGEMNVNFAAGYIPTPYGVYLRTTSNQFLLYDITATSSEVIAFDFTPKTGDLWDDQIISVRLRIGNDTTGQIWISDELLYDTFLRTQTMWAPLTPDYWFSPQNKIQSNFITSFNNADWIEIFVVRNGIEDTDSFVIDNFRIMEASADIELAAFAAEIATDEQSPARSEASAVDSLFDVILTEEWGEQLDTHTVNAEIVTGPNVTISNIRYLWKYGNERNPPGPVDAAGLIPSQNPNQRMFSVSFNHVAVAETNPPVRLCPNEIYEYRNGFAKFYLQATINGTQFSNVYTKHILTYRMPAATNLANLLNVSTATTNTINNHDSGVAIAEGVKIQGEANGLVGAELTTISFQWNSTCGPANRRCNVCYYVEYVGDEDDEIPHTVVLDDLEYIWEKKVEGRWTPIIQGFRTPSDLPPNRTVIGEIWRVGVRIVLEKYNFEAGPEGLSNWLYSRDIHIIANGPYCLTTPSGTAYEGSNIVATGYGHYNTAGVKTTNYSFDWERQSGPDQWNPIANTSSTLLGSLTNPGEVYRVRARVASVPANENWCLIEITAIPPPSISLSLTTDRTGLIATFSDAPEGATYDYGWQTFIPCNPAVAGCCNDPANSACWPNPISITLDALTDNPLEVPAKPHRNQIVRLVGIAKMGNAQSQRSVSNFVIVPPITPEVIINADKGPYIFSTFRAEVTNYHNAPGTVFHYNWLIDSQSVGRNPSIGPNLRSDYVCKNLLVNVIADVNGVISEPGTATVRITDFLQELNARVQIRPDFPPANVQQLFADLTEYSWEYTWGWDDNLDQIWGKSDHQILWSYESGSGQWVEMPGTKSQTINVPTAHSSPGVRWKVRVILSLESRCHESFVEASDEDTVTIGTPPLVNPPFTVAVSPSEPIAGSALVARITPNRGWNEYPEVPPFAQWVLTYTWHRNGALQSSLNTDTVPGSITEFNQLWRVDVTATIPNYGVVGPRSDEVRILDSVFDENDNIVPGNAETVADPVDVATGAFLASGSFTVPGTPPIDLTWSYTSLNTSRSLLGVGWSLNYQPELIVSGGSNEFLKIVLEDGADVIFQQFQNGSNLYLALTRNNNRIDHDITKGDGLIHQVSARIAKDNVANTYVYTAATGDVRTYAIGSLSGQTKILLVQTTDKHGNWLKFYYDNALTWLNSAYDAHRLDIPGAANDGQLVAIRNGRDATPQRQVDLRYVGSPPNIYLDYIIDDTGDDTGRKVQFDYEQDDLATVIRSEPVDKPAASPDPATTQQTAAIQTDVEYTYLHKTVNARVYHLIRYVTTNSSRLENEYTAAPDLDLRVQRQYVRKNSATDRLLSAEFSYNDLLAQTLVTTDHDASSSFATLYKYANAANRPDLPSGLIYQKIEDVGVTNATTSFEWNDRRQKTKIVEPAKTTEFIYDEDNDASYRLREQIVSGDITGDGVLDTVRTIFFYYPASSSSMFDDWNLVDYQETRSIDGTLLQKTDFDYYQQGDVRHGLIKKVDEIDPITDTPARTTTWTYDNSSNPTLPDSITVTGNGANIFTRYTYSADGQVLTQTVDPNNLSLQTTNDYYSDGSLKSVVNAADEVTLFGYDGKGRLFSMRDALGNDVISDYDPNGNIIKVAGPRTDLGAGASDVTFFAYDLANNLTQSGHSLDVANNITNPNFTHEYDRQGNRTATTEYPIYDLPSTHIRTDFYYDFRRRVTTKFVDSFDYFWNYVDLSSPSVQYTDIHGQATTIYQNALGDDISLRRPGFSSTDEIAIRYDLLGRRIMETDAENNRTELDYDAVGQVEELRRFDASGELISKSRFDYNPLGQVRFRYDVSAENDAKQRVTEFIYDSAGRLKETVGPDVPSGTIRLHEEFVYDAASRVVDRYRWRDETGQSKARTHFTYDDLGRVRSVTDPDNSTVWFGYNEAGMKTLELRSTKPVSISDLDTYDVDDPQFTHAREFRYNVKGELTRQLIQDVAGSPGTATYPDADYSNRHYKAIAYDYYGNGLLKSVTDPRGNRFLVEYDSLGRKTKYKVTPPGGTEITYLEFQYDNSDPAGYASMVTRLDFPSIASTSSQMATRFHLDGRGNIRLMEEGKFADNAFTALRSTTNTYYLNDRSNTSTIANIATSLTWQYDRLETVKPGTLPEYRWGYTEFGETEFITDTRTQKRVSFLYDENGGLAHESGYPSPGAGGLGVVPSVSYTRYPGDLMLQVATFAHRELQSDYALTPGGSLDFVGVKPTAAPWKFPYVVDQRNVLGQPIAVDLARGERYNLYRWNEYDNGTGKQKEQWLFTDLDEWELYFDAVDPASYDQLDRLKNYQSDFLDSDKSYTYSEPFGFLTGDSTATYTYDSLGNRLTRMAGTKTETYDYNDNVSGDKDPLNRLQSVTTTNGSTISEKRLYIIYDGRGNLDAQEIRNGQDTLIQSFDYVWDDAGRLMEVIVDPMVSDRVRVRYDYDALDRRILREVYVEVGGTWGDPISETHTIYAGNSPIAEVDGVGNVVKEMIWDPTRSGGIGGLLLLRVRDDYGEWHEYRPIYDFRGNVLAMVDEEGLIVERYEYDGFGRLRIFEISDTGVETLVAESGIGNTYLFSTKCLDPETGLYYFGARYYDPFQGRFISPDPLLFIDGPNRYVYVGNNPIGFIDPYGLAGVELLTNVSQKILEEILIGLEESGVQITRDLIARIVEESNRELAKLGLADDPDSDPNIIQAPTPIVFELIGPGGAKKAGSPNNLKKLSELVDVLKARIKQLNGPKNIPKLSEIGRAGSKGVREVVGNSKNARKLFDSLRGHNPVIEVKPGVFVAKGKNGGHITFRQLSKSGPPTVDVHGSEEGLRKIKFVKE